MFNNILKMYFYHTCIINKNDKIVSHIAISEALYKNSKIEQCHGPKRGNVLDLEIKVV